jgi:hypothetical protein
LVSVGERIGVLLESFYVGAVKRKNGGLDFLDSFKVLGPKFPCDRDSVFSPELHSCCDIEIAVSSKPVTINVGKDLVLWRRICNQPLLRI